MKRLLCILFVLLLLTGCADQVPESTATEPPVPWVEELGIPWDREGTLVELPLNVPNGIQYASYVEFDGDLLLWSVDNHLADSLKQELCVVELDTGEILAQKDIDISATIAPQVLGDKLYLSDCNAGKILELDKSLAITNSWEIEPCEASIYVGGKGEAYIHSWGESAYIVDLATGEKQILLDRNPHISYLYAEGDYLTVTYNHPDTGEESETIVDLMTGTLLEPPIQQRDTTAFYLDGTWLFKTYDDGHEFSLISEAGEPMTVETGYTMLELLSGDRLLMTNEAGNELSIHDLTGKALAHCTVTEQEYGYSYVDLIYNEIFDGYFVILSEYDGAMRLLFWNINAYSRGEDITFAPVPTPSEMEAGVRRRVKDMELEYGLNILVGEDAGTSFIDFDAERFTDWTEIDDALDTMEEALQVYPKGFFRQLRYGEVQRTEIHLAGTLTPTNSEYVDTYEAFVQDSYDCHVVVVDVDLADVSTYYHEFSHIIDSFLEWDAMQRSDALFSDDVWSAMNPDWFPGYTYDYSWERYLEDYSCFVDSYSTINPTEDRARVLEYAMVDYGYYTFEGCEVLLNKLDYYCRCIRDAFDTTGWPEMLPWEQYLP
jgi:hypothetical protein